MTEKRDHGGGLDAAVSQYGGTRESWLDLSTGINPLPYPVGHISENAWTALPDRGAFEKLERTARYFWQVPDEAEIVVASGASALIARLPLLFDGRHAHIAGPTYNEHAAAFRACGWQVGDAGEVQVVVHPNNPDGKIWQDIHGPCIIDESFCDVMPSKSLVHMAKEPDVVVLKSFGKFWGLAGLRLGFAICAPEMAERLREALGPWAVSGPALEIGARALTDKDWAKATRARLEQDAAQLDQLIDAPLVGGTSLFRLYDVGDAAAWQDRLAQGHVWSRIFPYSKTWLRLGLPAPDRWQQLEAAL